MCQVEGYMIERVMAASRNQGRCKTTKKEVKMLNMKKAISNVMLVGILFLSTWLVGGCTLPLLPHTLGEQLSLFFKEVIHISPEGHGTLERSLTTSSSLLINLYKMYWEQFETEPTVSEDFSTQVEREYVLLLDTKPESFQTRRAPLELTAFPNGQTEVHRLTAQLPYLASYDPNNNVWYVTIGPQGPEALDIAWNQTLTEMIFRAFLLESQPGQQRFEYHRETRFELPEEAVLTNREELENLSWTLDFGGGTALKAMLKLEDKAVTLVEDLIQSEEEPTHLVTEEGRAILYDSFKKYKTFVIKYLQDSKAAAPAASKPKTFKSLGIREYSKTWSFQYSKSKSMTLVYDPSYGSMTLKASAGFTATAYVGWRFSGSKLQWFEARIDLTPGLNISAAIDAKKGWSWNKTIPFWSYSNRFVFTYAPPVYITLAVNVDAKGSISARAKAGLGLQTGLQINSSGGVQYNGTNWTRIGGYNVSYQSPSVNVGVGTGITASAGPVLTLTAYVYDVAGPFLSIETSLIGKLQAAPQRTWELRARVQPTTGLKASKWIRKLLDWDLPQLTYSFNPWEQTLRSGSW